MQQNTTTERRSVLAAHIVPDLVYWGTVGLGFISALGVYRYGRVFLPMLVVAALLVLRLLVLSERRISKSHLRAWHLLKRAARRMNPLHTALAFGSLLVQAAAVAYRYFT